MHLVQTATDPGFQNCAMYRQTYPAGFGYSSQPVAQYGGHDFSQFLPAEDVQRTQNTSSSATSSAWQGMYAMAGTPTPPAMGGRTVSPNMDPCTDWNFNTGTTANALPNSNTVSYGYRPGTLTNLSPEYGQTPANGPTGTTSPTALGASPGMVTSPPVNQANTTPGGAANRQTQRAPYDWMKKNTYPTAPSSGKTRTKDKYRVVYSDHQRLELEKEFHYSRYITIRRKAELAQTLNLSERQVKIWFQNRRAKERKQNKKREENMSGDVKSQELSQIVHSVQQTPLSVQPVSVANVPVVTSPIQS